jgi:hypothetical protein
MLSWWPWRDHEDMKKKKSTSSITKLALVAWYAIGILFLLASLGVYLAKGARAFEILISDVSHSEYYITLLATLIVWWLAGVFVSMLHFDMFNANNVILWGGFFTIALVYVNLLRERVNYGDIDFYVEAAQALHKGATLPDTYLYPLLWVSILEIAAPLKQEGIFLFAWLLNVAALFGAYFILAKALQLYGFASNLSALIAFAFMLVNVPLLRTLLYGQVNLIVLDGMLLTLIWYRRFPFLSALAMTIAVQIKISPMVLVLAVLLERDWRWLAWFALNMLVIGAIPLMAHGIGNYYDVLSNLNLLNERTSYIFRDTSYDSFFLATTSMLNISANVARPFIYASKLIVSLFALRVAFASVRTSAFFSEQARGNFLYNSAPALMVLLTVVSPRVWEHHGVFLTLPFLILLKTLSNETDWFLFILASFFEFIIPTFDFYPWSYVRMVAPLIILWLLWMMSKRDKETKIFDYFNGWANSIFAKNVLS